MLRKHESSPEGLDGALCIRKLLDDLAGQNPIRHSRFDMRLSVYITRSFWKSFRCIQGTCSFLETHLIPTRHTEGRARRNSHHYFCSFHSKNTVWFLPCLGFACVFRTLARRKFLIHFVQILETGSASASNSLALITGTCPDSQSRCIMNSTSYRESFDPAPSHWPKIEKHPYGCFSGPVLGGGLEPPTLCSSGKCSTN